MFINLDSFNAHQSLYAFYVNPDGIQMDSRFAAGREDFSMDIVWYSAGQLTGDGYTVEIQIPLRSIRYSETNPVKHFTLVELLPASTYSSRFKLNAGTLALDERKEDDGESSCWCQAFGKDRFKKHDRLALCSG